MWPYSEWSIPVSSFITPVHPPTTEPEDCDRVCIEFNVAWLPYVLGALTQLLLQTTWIGTREEVHLTQLRANALINLIAEQGYDTMRCCDCPTPLYRWSDLGIIETSDDGGLTWTPAPTSVDPRVSGTIFPPLPGADSATKRCQAADNIVTTFTGLIDQSADELESAASVAEVATDIIAAVAIYLGAIGIIGGLAAVAAGKIFSFGASALRAAFDNDVFERLRCNLYCNGNDDASFNGTNLSQIHAQIDVDETGLANMHLHDLVTIFGAVGLTNMGRSGSGDGDDCGECGCGCTTTQLYFVDTGDWTGGELGTNGPFINRSIIPGQPLTLHIPDRAGRTIAGLGIGWTGASGEGNLTAVAGAQNSEESPVARTGSESPLHTFIPSVDDDDITVSTTGTYALNIQAFTVIYDC